MTRPFLAALVLTLFSLSASAQVKIHIPPEHQVKYEKIHASVENAGRKPVTICVEFGQWSPIGDGEIETSPSPFWVQKGDGKWSTLIIGPDVGSILVPQVLDPGKSLEFPFRLGDSGRMRLRMNYWKEALPSLDCRTPPKGAKLLTSAVFAVEERRSR